jgi:hypothetical protein
MQRRDRMKLVVLYSLKEGLDQAKLVQMVQKRAEYQPPEGIEPIAEYWAPKDSPAVIAIFEADDAAQILGLVADWQDYFTTDVFPVVSAEEGLASFAAAS